MARPPELKRLTLAAAIDLYLDTCHARVDVGDLSPATVRNYTADLRELQHILQATMGEGVIADDVEGTDLDRALREHAKRPDGRYRRDADGNPTRPGGRSAGTLRRFHQSVSMFFTNAVQRGWVQASPVDYASLKAPRAAAPAMARRSLTPAMARALLTHGAGTPPAPGEPGLRPHERNYTRDKALLGLLLTVGPRVSEVCRADTTDFDFAPGDSSAAWLIHGKGGKDRTAHLPAFVVADIRAYLHDRPDPTPGLYQRHKNPGERDQRVRDARRAMFRTGHGGRLSPRDIQRLMHRAVQRVAQHAPDAVRDVTPHGLRHTAATVILADGWDIKLVKILLGHQNITTTSVYVDELPGELQAAMRTHSLTPDVAGDDKAAKG